MSAVCVQRQWFVKDGIESLRTTTYGKNWRLSRGERQVSVHFEIIYRIYSINLFLKHLLLIDVIRKRKFRI